MNANWLQQKWKLGKNAFFEHIKIAVLPQPYLSVSFTALPVLQVLDSFPSVASNRFRNLTQDRPLLDNLPTL